MREFLFRLDAEWKKVGGGFFALLLVGLPAGVFLVTCAFLLFQRERAARLPLEMIVTNNLGAWSALLYPLALIGVVQSLVDVEIQARQLVYLRAFKRRWYDLFLLKATVALLAIAILTISNIACNWAVVMVAQRFAAAGDAASLILQSTLSFTKFIPVLLPAIFFHLMLALTIQAGGKTYLVGILLIVAGIPVTNLTDWPVFPYSFGILVLQPDPPVVTAAAIGVLFLIACPVLAHYVLRK